MFMDALTVQATVTATEQQSSPKQSSPPPSTLLTSRPQLNSSSATMPKAPERRRERERPLFSYTELPTTESKLVSARQYLNGIVSSQFPDNIEVLDFRCPECWVGSADAADRPPDTAAHCSRWTFQLHGIEPPDEFDWVSLDRMGKMMSMNEACDVFSMLKLSNSAGGLKELMINARRALYLACTKDQMLVITETLLQMKNLTKIVLRGLADDKMMQLIGQTATGLKYVDVSCSRFVTDKGILHIFFKTVVENSAQYLIRSWIQKNLANMWPHMNTLEHLDFSWTNVTSLSRKMVNLLPGSYMFKRHFAETENEAFGHHAFIRKMPDYTTKLHTLDRAKSHTFQAELHSFAGRQGVTSFVRFLERHAWKNCHFAVFVYRPQQVPIMGTLLKADELDDSVSVCIITPTHEDKRIHGLVTFWQGNLIELYSIYPININQLGTACHKLRILSATITDVWRHTGCCLFPTLAEADLFSEPDSIMSLLNSCPNLKKVRARIIKKLLKDEALIQALSFSMSNRYLEELWIAPGSYKQPAGTTPESSDIDDYESRVSLLSSSLIIPAGETSGTKLFHASADDVDDSRIEDLVHLSASCLRRLFCCCKKLNRVGNLASWHIAAREMETLCSELAETNSGVKLLWDNTVISVGSTLNNDALDSLT